jgi:hypothetical protein
MLDRGGNGQNGDGAWPRQMGVDALFAGLQEAVATAEAALTQGRGMKDDYSNRN